MTGEASKEVAVMLDFIFAGLGIAFIASMAAYAVALTRG
jgi:hypothetical protein